MVAIFPPAYYALDPFVDPHEFNSIITSDPCFSPLVSNDFPLSADPPTHLAGNADETFSSTSWIFNDLEHQDSPLQPKRNRLEFEEEKDSIEKWERKRAKPGARKERKKVAEKQQPLTSYVHVRARRGEATDPHSLAERVRRKKINVRMQLLQSLVPGCHQLTGKALILDEIIKYVLTLQNQVEFLASKLGSEGCITNGVNYNIQTQEVKEPFSSEMEASSCYYSRRQC